MKKFIVLLSAILLVVLLSFSIMSFRDNDPKIKKTESTTAAKSEKQADNAACQKDQSGSCCEKKCDKDKECSKSGEAESDKK